MYTWSDANKIRSFNTYHPFN